MVGLPGQHRLLGGPLDAVRDLCAERGWPDISTMVVNKDTLSDGTLMPSQAAVEKHGGPLGLRREQAQVITFDWGKLP